MWKRNCFKLLCLILSLSFLTALPSCSKKEAGSVTEPASFTDSMGRSITLEEKPKRVAALLGSFADLWVLAGGELCAVADDAEDFGLNTDGLIQLGGAHSPSLEQLLSADPDFVLASASTAAHVNMLDSLEQAGIPVAYFDVDSFEDYLSMLKICTDLTGNRKAFEANGADLANEIQAIKSDFQALDLSEEEKTVLVLRISSGLVKAKSSKGTILGEMLADLGCINLADSDGKLTEQLNLEYILQKNPRHILVVTMGDEEKAKKNFQTMMEENPAWSSLDAVKENRMHILEKRLFNQKPNARWAIAYETLAKLLEP
ncbi:MAG: ABC transporter substrate-binding protein [Clostridia bacterium]|nr:ABC transporter substrate-binding protein [Clostridia bacterium]